MEVSIQTTGSGSSTRRNIFLVTGGQVALLALWFGATTLLARKLGPEILGLYALATRAIKIVTTCVGEPLDLAVMRTAPLFLRTDRRRAISIARAAFAIRTLFGALSLLASALFPTAIAWMLFGNRDLTDLALLTGFGILTDLLLRSAAGFLQASERFGPFITVNSIWQIARAGAIVALILVGMITARSALAIYVFAPLVAFLVAIPFLPRDLLRPTPAPRISEVIDVLHYGKWIALATMFATLYEGLDAFLLGWLRGDRDVGIYAGAMTLAMIPDFLNGAIQSVLAPRIAPAHAAGRFGALYRQYLRYSLPLGAVALAGALLLGGPIIRGLLSTRYIESIGAFKILIVATILDIVFLPLPAALIAFVRPRAVPAMNLAALMFVVVGGIALIPRYGVLAAAGLIVAARITIGCLTFIVARRILRADGAAASPA